MENETYIPLKRHCWNCSCLLYGSRNCDNTARLRCPNCGMQAYSIRKTRRKEVVTFYAPFDGIT